MKFFFNYNSRNFSVSFVHFMTLFASSKNVTQAILHEQLSRWKEALYASSESIIGRQEVLRG